MHFYDQLVSLTLLGFIRKSSPSQKNDVPHLQVFLTMFRSWKVCRAAALLPELCVPFDCRLATEPFIINLVNPTNELRLHQFISKDEKRKGKVEWFGKTLKGYFLFPQIDSKQVLPALLSEIMTDRPIDHQPTLYLLKFLQKKKLSHTVQPTRPPPPLLYKHVH